MSRTIATVKRPTPHTYQADPETPGCCKECRLIEAAGVHSKREIDRHNKEIEKQDAARADVEDRIHEAQEHHRRMTGER